MKTFIVVAILAFAGVGMYLLLSPMLGPSTPSPTPTTTPTGTQTYSSSEAGLSFEYPTTYRLEERNETFEGQPIKVITLIDKDVVIPDMSEGPPAISIIVVPVASSTQLSTWVKTKSISNFQLSPDQTLASTTVDGAPAVSYTHSGLYESRAIAALAKGKVYLMSVGSINPNDTLYRDFQKLISTVQF